MKRTLLFSAALAALALAASSCAKTKTPGPDGPSGSNPVVHTVGYYYDYDDTYRYGCRWADGVRTDLPLPAGVSSCYTEGIAVSGGKVYVSGDYWTGSMNIICYWTDNARTDLEGPDDDMVNNSAYGIAVSGGDVYTLANYDNVCGYLFKNTARTELSHPVGATYYSGSEIAVSDGKVYVAGIYSVPGLSYNACVWTDNVITDLSVPEEASGSGIFSIAVEGGKVYCTGYYNDTDNDQHMCYWADGVLHELSAPSGSNAYGQSIAVADGTIYIAGRVYGPDFVNYACLSTDNVPAALDLPDGATWSEARYVTVHDGKVCVAGDYIKDDKCYTCYWIDGVRGGDAPLTVPDDVHFNISGMTLAW